MIRFRLSFKLGSVSGSVSGSGSGSELCSGSGQVQIKAKV